MFEMDSSKIIMHPNPLAKENSEANFVTATEFGKFEICLVFPSDPSTRSLSPEGQEIMKKITDSLGQKNVLMYFSVDRDEIFALIRADLEKIKFFADSADYKVLLSEEGIISQAKAGWPESNYELNTITPYRPFENLYGNYHMQPEFAHMYANADGVNHPFSPRIRLDIMKRLIEQPTDSGGMGIKLRQLQKIPKDGSKPILMSAFPLHDREAMKVVQDAWYSWENILPWNQPFDLIKDYFGPKIALYYMFMGECRLNDN